jgi:uncharacterized membrane protein required for colicin V production
MIWVDIIALVVIVLSFFSGLREGAPRQGFKLLVLLIAIPLAGRTYWLAATVLSFLPGENWENFIGFFITLGVISAVLQLVSFLPRRIIQKIWRGGLLFRLLGGALGVLNVGIGLVVLALVTLAYPLFDWLARWVAGSSVLMSLLELFGFVQMMLPQIFQDAATLVLAGPLV